MKKFFLSVVTLFACAAASFATDYARIDLNFWCNGNLKCLTQSPPGVQVTGRRKYTQEKYANICYYSITVNLEKAWEVDLEYEVLDTGDKSVAKLVPSITPVRLPKNTGIADVECVEFEFNGRKSALTLPCKIDNWTNMLGGNGVNVSAGDKFTIKVKFKAPEK